jgi:hypothetical protein
MMRLVEQRIVTRSQAEAFNFTADFSNSAKWDPGVAASSQIGNGPVGLGAEFELEVKFGTSSIPMTYRITVFEPNDRVVLEGTGDRIQAVDDIRFRSAEGKTVIDYTADLSFDNFFKYLAPFAGPLMSRVVGKRALDGLASALSL